MRVKQRIGCVAIVILAIVFILFFGYYILCRPEVVYETNNVADYGIVKGNYDNERPTEFIFSFFPKAIEECFSDVRYHYKAKKSDTYAYEMYMEFEIKDTQTYNEFIADVIGDNAVIPFAFNEEYLVHYVSNYLYLSPALAISHNDKAKQPVVKEDMSKPPVIENAKIGAVLFSDTEQRIIFFALGVYDGGGTSTDELNYFFERFDVNPWVYEKKAIQGISS